MIESQAMAPGAARPAFSAGSQAGGTVIAASSGTTVMRLPAALAEDMTQCPLCKGSVAMKPDGTGARHEGKAYAYNNDVTACGASLITSLN